MDWKVIVTTLATYVLLMSSVMLIMLSIIGVTYFENEILIFSPKPKLLIVFGCGIAVSILIFAGIWVFLLFPSWKLNYIVTFPLFFIAHISYIAFARPGSTVSYLADWAPFWIESPLIVESFQMRHECCGWSNSSDNGFLPCPHSFESGCANLITEYLNVRFNEILIGGVVGMSMGLVSSVWLFTAAYRSPDSPLITRLADE
jgi:hypothetical protein